MANKIVRDELKSRGVRQWEMIPVKEPEPAPITVNIPALPEMLTVKECAKLVTD